MSESTIRRQDSTTTDKSFSPILSFLSSSPTDQPISSSPEQRKNRQILMNINSTNNSSTSVSSPGMWPEAAPSSIMKRTPLTPLVPTLDAPEINNIERELAWALAEAESKIGTPVLLPVAKLSNNKGLGGSPVLTSSSFQLRPLLNMPLSNEPNIQLIRSSSNDRLVGPSSRNPLQPTTAATFTPTRSPSSQEMNLDESSETQSQQSQQQQQQLPQNYIVRTKDAKGPTGLGSSPGSQSKTLAKAAVRESNINTSLTAYLQHQLSLFSKRGQARRILKMLEDRNEADILAAAAAKSPVNKQQTTTGADGKQLTKILEETASKVALSLKSPLQIAEETQREFEKQSKELFPTGSSTMKLPTIPQAKLLLPSSHFLGSVTTQQEQEQSNNGVASAPLDSITARARMQYATLEHQASYIRRREEKEVDVVGRSTSPSHQSPTRSFRTDSWDAPNHRFHQRGDFNSAYGVRDSTDGFGRKFLMGLASDEEKRARFEFLRNEHGGGDPLPDAVALKRLTNQYHSRPAPRDHRPYVSGAGGTGAERNASLDFEVLHTQGQPGWQRALKLAKALEKHQADPSTTTANTSSSPSPPPVPPSYVSGSQSARGYHSRPFLGALNKRETPSQIACVNPPLPARSFHRNLHSLAYKLNSTVGDIIGRSSNNNTPTTGASISVVPAGSQSAHGAGNNGPNKKKKKKILTKQSTNPFDSHAAVVVPPAPYTLPSNAPLLNLYATAGFRASDLLAMGIDSVTIGAPSRTVATAGYGSFSATGGFRTQTPQTPMGVGEVPPLIYHRNMPGSPGTPAGHRHRRHPSSGVHKPLLGADGNEVSQVVIGYDDEGRPIIRDLAAERQRAEMDQWKANLAAMEGTDSSRGSQPFSHASVFKAEDDESKEKEKEDQSLSSLLDFSDRNGSTPLFHSAWEGFVPIVSLLCEFGADVNVRNVRKHTAIDMAIERSHIDVVKILLRYGSDASYSEARSARARCHARLGQTYQNWLKRMQNHQVLPTLKEADAPHVEWDAPPLTIFHSALTADPESTYYIPLHLGMIQMDREILTLFAQTIFRPVNAFLAQGNIDVNTGMAVQPLTSKEATSLGVLTKLTREQRLNKANKLKMDRLETNRLKKKILNANPSSADVSARSSLIDFPVSPLSRNQRNVMMNESILTEAQQRTFDSRRSILANLTKVREQKPKNPQDNEALVSAGAAPDVTKSPPVHPAIAAVRNAIDKDMNPPEDGLYEYERELNHTKQELELQRRFYMEQSALIRGQRAEKDAAYSSYEAWVDCLELGQAVLTGDLAMTEKILLAHPEHSAFIFHGCTLLYHAAYHGHYGVARALLAASIECRLERGLERAVARASHEANVGEVRADIDFNDPTHPMYDTTHAPDGTELPAHNRLCPYYSRTSYPSYLSAPSNSTLALDGSEILPPILDVNTLCVDYLKTKEESDSDRIIRKQMEARAQNRTLRRKIADKRAQASRIKEMERERNAALGVYSDSSDDDVDDDGSLAGLGPLQARSAKARKAASQQAALEREQKQLEADAKIDVVEGAPPNPLQFQLWHQWVVNPREWNRSFLELREQERKERVAMHEPFDEDYESHQRLDQLLYPEDYQNPAAKYLPPEQENGKDIRYETAIYVAVKRKHYRVALMLASFGAISPYSQQDLYLLCDIQLRARKLMDSIRENDYASITNVLNEAAGAAPRPVLTQLLNYQDTQGANPVLMAIQRNDLRAMEAIKAATLSIGMKQDFNAAIYKGAAHLAAAGGSTANSDALQAAAAAAASGANPGLGASNLFARLLSTIKDRLGYTALETSIQNATVTPTGVDALATAPSNANATASGTTGNTDMTSYLLTQTGLTLTTASIIDLILNRQSEDSGVSHYSVSYEGVDKLRSIVMNATAAATNPSPASGSLARLHTPRGSMVVNFSQLYSTLNKNHFNLRQEQLAEISELVQNIEIEQNKLVSIARANNGGRTPSSVPSSPSGSRGNSAGMFENQLKGLYDHDMEVVEEEEGFGAGGGGSDNPLDFLSAGSEDVDGKSAVRETARLIKKLQAVERQQEHQAKLQASGMVNGIKLPDDFDINKSGLLDTSSDEDEAAEDENSTVDPTTGERVVSAKERRLRPSSDQEAANESLESTPLRRKKKRFSSGNTGADSLHAGEMEEVDEVNEEAYMSTDLDELLSQGMMEIESGQSGDFTALRDELLQAVASAAAGDENASSGEEEDGEDGKEDDGTATGSEGGEKDGATGSTAALASSPSKSQFVVVKTASGRSIQIPLKVWQAKKKNFLAKAQGSASFSFPTNALGVHSPGHSLYSPRSGKRIPVIDIKAAMNAPLPTLPPEPPKIPVRTELLTVYLKAKLMWILDEIESHELLAEYILSSRKWLLQKGPTSVGGGNIHMFPELEFDSTRASSAASVSRMGPSPSPTAGGLESYLQSQSGRSSKMDGNSPGGMFDFTAQVDLTRIRWSGLLHANPHIRLLLGIDYPVDFGRLVPVIEETQPSLSWISSTETSRRGSVENRTNQPATQQPNSLLAPVPPADAAPTIASSSSAVHSATQSRRGSTDAPLAIFGSSLAVPSAGEAAESRIPPPHRQVSHNHPARKIVPKAAGAPFMERPSPPLRTITEPAWLEAFERLAHEKSLSAVREIVEEFERIGALAKQEARRLALLRKKASLDPSPAAESTSGDSSDNNGNNAAGTSATVSFVTRLQNTDVNPFKSRSDGSNSQSKLITADVDFSDIPDAIINANWAQQTGLSAVQSPFAGPPLTGPNLSSSAFEKLDDSKKISAERWSTAAMDAHQLAANSIFTFVSHMDPTTAPDEVDLTEQAARAALNALNDGNNSEMQPIMTKKNVRWRGGE